MATLIRLPGGSKNKGSKGKKGPYYARIYIPRPGQRPKQKLIALKTENVREAALRHQEVERKEPLIKQGVDYNFPWLDGSATSVKQATIDLAAAKYLRIRAEEGIRPKTIDISRNAIRHLINIIGAGKPIENVSTDDIRDFVRASREHFTPNTINMNLRAIKTFFRWAEEEGMVSSIPKIKEIAASTGLPRYLSDDEFNRLQDAAPAFLADVFWFYRETGCRLREPFNAELRGSFLIVPTDKAKGKTERQIPLNHDLIRIYEALMESSYTPKYYSDKFREITRTIGIDGHKFHDLRHTFGVRTWLQTGDLHLVGQLMGHESIDTTQIYAKFFIQRLEEDFPELSVFSENRSLGRANIIQRGNLSPVENRKTAYTGERIPD